LDRTASTLIACFRLDPAMLVPGQVSKVFAAGAVINQIDDECPHDRTPLFDRRCGSWRLLCFRLFSCRRENDFAGELKLLRPDFALQQTPDARSVFTDAICCPAA
jgi:hypothetical protein